MNLSTPLVVRSPNWLGDVVMTLPAVANLKEHLGTKPLTVAAPPSVAPLWKTCPFVDQVLVLEHPKNLWRTSRQLAAARFRSALLFPNSLRAALEAKLAGVSEIIGYGGRARRWLGVKTVDRRPFDLETMHQKYDWLHLVAACGANEEERSLVWNQNLTAGEKPAEAPIVICPGAEYGPAKRWPEANYVILAQHLISQYSLPIHFMGTKTDATLGAELAKRVPGSLNLCGQTNLHEFMAHLSQARLFIGNDSGGMHLAALLGIPGVALFGSTEPRLTGPLGQCIRVLRHHVPCSPCFLRQCPLDFACLSSLTPAYVLSVCEELLSKTSSSVVSSK